MNEQTMRRTLANLEAYVSDRRDPHKEAYRNAMNAHRDYLESLKAAKRKLGRDLHLLVREKVEESL